MRTPTGLQNLKGTLEDVYLAVVRDTIQHVSELTRDVLPFVDSKTGNVKDFWTVDCARKLQHGIPKDLADEIISFWTADSALYDEDEDGEVVLYIGDIHTNFVLSSSGGEFRDAIRQLASNGDYQPSFFRTSILNDSIASGGAVKVRLSELCLQGKGDFQGFHFSPQEYESLNTTQRTLVEAIFGMRANIADNMAKLTKTYDSIGIAVLNPGYVRAKRQADYCICRLCILSELELLGSKHKLEFYACDPLFDEIKFLRGMLR